MNIINNDNRLSNYGDYRLLQLENVAKEVEVANERALTGKYTSDLSSQPKVFQQVSRLNGVIASKKQAIEDISENKLGLDYVGSALRKINTLVQEAHSIALKGSHSSDQVVMKSLSGTVEGLKKNLVNISNSQDLQGGYIFGGYDKENKPFTEGTRLTDPADLSSEPIKTLIFSGADYVNNQKKFIIEDETIEVSFPPNQFFKDLYETLDNLSLHLETESTANITTEDLKDPVSGNIVSVPGDIDKLKSFLNINLGNMGNIARINSELEVKDKIAHKRIEEVTKMISDETDISLDQAVSEQNHKQDTYNALFRIGMKMEQNVNDNLQLLFRNALSA